MRLIKLIAYGNFREGEPLAHHLDGPRKKGVSTTVTLMGVKLFIVGDAPAAVVTQDQDDFAVVEVLEAILDNEEADEMLELLDAVEGVHIGLYRREEVLTPKGPALIYVYNRQIDPKTVVITDWKEWKKIPVKERMRKLEGVKLGVYVRGTN